MTGARSRWMSGRPSSLAAHARKPPPRHASARTGGRTAMRLDELYLWYLGNPAAPRYVGALRLVAAGKGVSLRYGEAWLADGFALSEDLPLVDVEHLPPGRLVGDTPRAVGAVD